MTVNKFLIWLVAGLAVINLSLFALVKIKKNNFSNQPSSNQQKITPQKESKNIASLQDLKTIPLKTTLKKLDNEIVPVSQGITLLEEIVRKEGLVYLFSGNYT